MSMVNGVTVDGVGESMVAMNVSMVTVNVGMVTMESINYKEYNCKIIDNLHTPLKKI